MRRRPCRGRCRVPPSCAEKTLHGRVVVALTGPAETLLSPDGREVSRERYRSDFPAAVRVKQEPSRDVADCEGSPEGASCQLRAELRLDGPADHAPAEEVQDGHEKRRAVFSLEVGGIGEPGSIRSVVETFRLRGERPSRPSEAMRRATDPLAAHALPGFEQLSVHTRRTVGCSGQLEDRPNEQPRPSILTFAVPSSPGPPRLESAS